MYQELRTAVTPWTKSHGFRRWSGTQAGWQKAINAEHLLGFKFEGYRMVNPDIGSSLTGLVQREPSSGEVTAHSIRQASFSCCLVRSELDQLGYHLRGLYERFPEYREGQLVQFSYHSIGDVRDLVTFIVAVLPAVLDRFLEGRVAKPIDTTPLRLRPKWL